MTHSQFPTAQGVARIVAANVRAELQSKGYDLDWLAGRVDVSVATILRHFSEGVPAWLTLDIANVLDVDAGRLVTE